MEEVSVF